MKEKLAKICAAFRISGMLQRYEKINSGHINDTYIVIMREKTLDGAKDISYILQKINSHVFRNPAAVMKNIDLITNHLLRKTMGSDCHQLHYYTTASNKNYWIYAENGAKHNEEFWRAANFIDHATEFYGTKTVYMVGKAFGQFQARLFDFDASQLEETIPDFHNTERYFNALLNHAERDPYGYALEIQKELDEIQTFIPKVQRMSALLRSGKIPLRAVHNDAKCDNALLDRRTLEPLSVIDLDTVMPGAILYDFGDAVRSAAGITDSDDATKRYLDMNLYRAFAEGFISAANRVLTQDERNELAFGALIVTVELSARYLDDYIMGSSYFKIEHPRHNLIRARSQLALAKDMQRKYREMEQTVHKIFRDLH